MLDPHDSRRILHCDMDCFYAAVHMRDDPRLAGKPVVIGGSPDSRGVVAAASYEARAFGIRSAIPCSRAYRLCPDAVFLRPDFPRYRAESDEVFSIFREFTDLVQVVSIDEAYLDVTERLEEWGSATAIAKEIRRRVRDERRLTVSVGVGPNRLVAKIASDMDKPDGLTVVPPRRVLEFLAPLSVRALPGVGPATQARLKDLGLETVQDLRDAAEGLLERRLGRYGGRLRKYASGIDERAVRTHRVRKSLSSERTYAEDLASLDEMRDEIERLALQVAASLRKRELFARTVQIKVRYEDFTTVTRARTLPGPVADDETFVSVAMELLSKTEAGARNVRLLGVGGAGLATGEAAQLGLF